MYVTQHRYAPSQPARNATRGHIALVQHPARNAVCAAFAAVSSSVITARVNRTQTTGALRTAAARKQQYQAQSLKQRHPGGRSAFTHVCRVLTESADMALGSKAPDFELLEPLTGRQLSLSAMSSGAKATLVMFICNHCPFVVMLKDAIAKLAAEYQPKGVVVVAISSNSVQTHPQDGPDKMAEDAKKHGYTFPYLFDESQAVAKAYKAACTPEFYVFDSNLLLTYHGQFDDARPNSNKLVTGSDLRTALDATLAGNALPEGFKAKPSIGCNIKWTPGSEPDYYGMQIVQK